MGVYLSHTAIEINQIWRVSPFFLLIGAGHVQMLILCCLAVGSRPTGRRTKSGGIRNAWTEFFSGLQGPSFRFHSAASMARDIETCQIQEALRVICWVMSGRPYPESIRSMGMVYLPFIYHKNHQSMWGSIPVPWILWFFGTECTCHASKTWQNHLTNPPQRTLTQLAVYTTYIPLIYCQLDSYMLPTTY